MRRIARSLSWPTMAAVLVVLGLAGGLYGFALLRDDTSTLGASGADRDPSRRIPGIELRGNLKQDHVEFPERVAYDRSLPVGGPHDQYWAACNGVVYPRPVRTENMVHSLEHGAVWIAYDPTRIAGGALEALRGRVQGQQYLVLSPYPGLDRPISAQSWGHRLGIDAPDDPRLDEFVSTLRENPDITPEIGASCDVLGPEEFDQDNPPPFDPTPPGPGAVPMAAGPASPARSNGAI